MALLGGHHRAPWVVHGSDVCDRGGVPVATVHQGAHAERIAACVTACEGIPTEQLRAGVIQDLLACCEHLPTPRLQALLKRMRGEWR